MLGFNGGLSSEADLALLGPAAGRVYAGLWTDSIPVSAGLRKGKQTELNYMYAALGMGKDDSSDAHFLPDDREESEDVYQSSDDLDDLAPQTYMLCARSQGEIADKEGQKDAAKAVHNREGESVLRRKTPALTARLHRGAELFSSLFASPL
ncbi:hypothetical protein GN244_ATG06205 [Phytophthora infestans]|uniref:Uncharacterized protein n=1 Tax=Phytophthora infestans TaxID=4787 RepID=A0A833TIS7_PHYIN|nr:hypothetical protein GN244_ATG06205 [Phytophthora infestans]